MRGLDSHALFGAREEDLDGCTSADLAIYRNIAAVLLDDPVAGRQAQPGALAALFGGEKRLEQMGLDIGRHTAPRIAHRHQHMWAGQRADVLARILAIEYHIVRLDGEFAALG